MKFSFVENVSAAFINQYMYDKHVTTDVVDSAATSNGSKSATAAGSISLQVTMCSLTMCDHCSALLYDENIMAGWSAQDSDLSTVYVDVSVVCQQLSAHVKTFVAN